MRLRIPLLIVVLSVLSACGAIPTVPAPTPTMPPQPVIPDGWQPASLEGYSFAIPPDFVVSRSKEGWFQAGANRGRFLINVMKANEGIFTTPPDDQNARTEELKQIWLEQGKSDGSRITFGSKGIFHAPYSPAYVDSIVSYPRTGATYASLSTYATDGEHNAYVVVIDADSLMTPDSTIYLVEQLLNSFSFR